MEYGILIVGWCVFFFLHSWLAADRCKTWARLKMGSHFSYYRLLYSVVAFVTLASILAWQFSMPVLLLPVHPFVKYFLAAPFVVTGGALMAVCIRKYFFRLSGAQVLYQQEESPVLETGGVHRWVRHPLYIGTLLLIWGLLAFFPTVANLISCALITIYVRVGIPIEEDKLMHVFGDQYRAYKSRTPMLIPGGRR